MFRQMLRPILGLGLLFLIASPLTAVAAPPAPGGTYLVQRGDTLAKIAARLGVSQSVLARANGISDPNLIYAGQGLIVPGSNLSSSSAPARSQAGGSEPRTKLTPDRGTTPERWIDVNLTAQTLIAYEGKRAVFTTRVSSGRPGTPTVTGSHRIYVKIPSKTLTGPGYRYPGVPYVMFFYKDYAIHSAYWHNNFGLPVSHGCVNVSTPDAAWLYKWARVGTRVVTHY
jgi:lipoprotein-anchoring transpeptidase ErfK/SrfK